MSSLYLSLINIGPTSLSLPRVHPTYLNNLQTCYRSSSHHIFRLSRSSLPFISPFSLNLPVLFIFSISSYIFFTRSFFFPLFSYISYCFSSFIHFSQLYSFLSTCIFPSIICSFFFFCFSLSLSLQFFQSPHSSSHLTSHRRPLVNWCTLPAWCHLVTCPYASHGARTARRSFLPPVSRLTQRSSWAPSRYRRCHSNTMATTPALPATMLLLWALRGSSRSQVRKPGVRELWEYQRDGESMVSLKEIQFFQKVRRFKSCWFLKKNMQRADVSWLFFYPSLIQFFKAIAIDI